MAGMTLAMPPRFIDLIESSGARVLINVFQITAIYENDHYTCIRTADNHIFFFNDSMTVIVRQVLQKINM